MTDNEHSDLEFLGDEPVDAHDPDKPWTPKAEGWSSEGEPGRAGPETDGGSAGFAILGLVALNLGMVVGMFMLLRHILGAERFLLEESAELGGDLAATLTGLRVLRVAVYVLIAGFGLSAIGMVLRSRRGRVVQVVWAVLLCVTLIGAVYAIPVLLILRRPAVRARFDGPPMSVA